MGVLFFFIDGFGLGEDNNTKNPLLKYMDFFNTTFGQDCFVNNNKIKENGIGILKPIDACLDVKGLPQSATGQTSIFTGINASKYLGYHLTAMPNTKLRGLIKEHSFLKQLKDKGFNVTSANAYSKRYFKLVEEGDLMHSASTVTIMAADIDFRLVDELKKGEAVYMDITNKWLKQYYPDVETISIKQAAKNLSNIIKKHDLTMYEYFLTDYFGHLKGTHDDIKRVLSHIDELIKHLTEYLDLEHNTIVITSDHGNIENIEKKPHTFNPVPLIVFSKNKDTQHFFAERINSIVDVTPALLEYFTDFNKN